MSLMTIDSLTYSTLLSQAISRYLARGYPRSAAVQAAHRVMESAFLCAEREAARQDQLDDDEVRDGDWTR